MAIASGTKTELRIPLTAENCVVHPGSWAGLDLDSGRARRGSIPQLRARCRFDSGNVRAVTVMPKTGRGDLLWVRRPRGSRAQSGYTLEVTGVDITRVQDMTNADARAEGAEELPARMRRYGNPRDWFAEFWEEWKGAHAWRRNDWCWVIRFRVHREQVDRLLERWREE